MNNIHTGPDVSSIPVRKPHYGGRKAGRNVSRGVFWRFTIALSCFLMISGCTHFKLIQETWDFESLRRENGDCPGTVGDEEYIHREVNIILPDDYDEGHNVMRRYPTLYILHGFSMDADAVRGMAQIVLGSCEELYKDGRIGDLIVVMPNSGTDMCIDSRELACGSFYRESWQIGDFQSYILKELIDTVDREFRTLRSVDRRAITGISMGGYGAFQLTMESNTDDRWPRRFGSAACHSGLLSFEYMRDMLANPPAWTVLFEDQLAEYIETVIIPALTSALSPGLDLELSYDETTGEIHCNQEVWRLWVENDPVRYLREHGTDAFENTALYMDCGLNDELGFLQHANLFSHVLDSLEIDHIYEPYVWEWTGEETLDYLLSGHWLIAFRIKESIQFHWDKWYPED